MADPVADLAARVRACRFCVETPRGRPLLHEPRPVLRVSETARILVAGQAPGNRVHLSGTPYTDPSGARLRGWMGVDDATFYDVSRIAIVPMGFCFPGYDAKGGDRPPRPECAPLWHDRLMDAMPRIELIIAAGRFAQAWHFRRAGLGALLGATIGETVANWRLSTLRNERPAIIPLPHPSWRNNAWLKRNPWFEAEVIPALRDAVARRLAR